MKYLIVLALATAATASVLPALKEAGMKLAMTDFSKINFNNFNMASVSDLENNPEFGQFLTQLLDERTEEETNEFRRVLKALRDLIPRPKHIDPDVEEDANLNPAELLNKYGYPAETYTVKTDDGYNVKLFRIPNPGKPAVFLQHGLMDTAASMLIAGPKSGLGYVMYRAGYDVWLGNYRGNKYSRTAGRYDPEDAAFWDFSWHEIGVHDLPALIDFVLATTKQKQLNYIGHSQGCTSFMVLCSEKPEYNKKIKQMHALAPPIYMDQVSDPAVRSLATFLTPVTRITERLKIHNVIIDNDFLVRLGQAACFIESFEPIFCKNMPLLVTGQRSEHTNATRFSAILGSFPGGAATRQFFHYAQLIRTGKFQKYDFGATKNKELYGRSTPPAYKIENVSAPVYIHFGYSDRLATASDAIKLSHTLENVVGIRPVSSRSFNHVDFLWAEDGPEMVYDFVVSELNKVNKK